MRKHKHPLPLHNMTADYVSDKHLCVVFLWNAYQREILDDDQYEAGMVLAGDGWKGTPQELVEAARKL